jgi:hypothetical protein
MDRRAFIQKATVFKRRTDSRGVIFDTPDRSTVDHRLITPIFVRNTLKQWNPISRICGVEKTLDSGESVLDVPGPLSESRCRL